MFEWLEISKIRCTSHVHRPAARKTKAYHAVCPQDFEKMKLRWNFAAGAAVRQCRWVRTDSSMISMVYFQAKDISRNIMDKVEVHLMPSMNPDGFNRYTLLAHLMTKNLSWQKSMKIKLLWKRTRIQSDYNVSLKMSFNNYIRYMKTKVMSIS